MDRLPEIHACKVRPRKDHRGVDLISDVLPFRRLWYGEPNAVGNAVDYAKFYRRSHDAVIRVCDDVGNMPKRSAIDFLTAIRAFFKSDTKRI
jgi:hypothetical protein